MSFSAWLIASPAFAQNANLPGGASGANVDLGAINLRPTQIAQVRPQNLAPQLSGPLPTDVTPIGIGNERQLFQPGLGFWISQKLPARLWINMTTEASQRLETNVFATNNRPVSDYVFRIFPNITIGYNVLKHTSIYSNYFLIKDVYANQPILSTPNTQSLSVGIRHDIPIKQRNAIQFDFQARELWQLSHLQQADLLPSILLTRAFTPNLIGFASSTLQMRSKNFFGGPTRELDPFWSFGAIYRRHKWTFSASNTFVYNFRHHDAIPQQSNITYIADLEASYPLTRKFPGLDMFLRAEPIYSASRGSIPGLSGFDFRLFSGVRMAVNKPSYGMGIIKLREYVEEGSPPRQTTQRLHSLLAMLHNNSSTFAEQLSRQGWLPPPSIEPESHEQPMETPVTQPTSAILDDAQSKTETFSGRINSAGMLPTW